MTAQFFRHSRHSINIFELINEPVLWFHMILLLCMKKDMGKYNILVNFINVITSSNFHPQVPQLLLLLSLLPFLSKFPVTCNPICILECIFLCFLSSFFTTISSMMKRALSSSFMRTGKYSSKHAESKIFLSLPQTQGEPGANTYMVTVKTIPGPLIMLR